MYLFLDMGRKKDINLGKKEAILALIRESNLSYADIAHSVGVSRPMVSKLAKQHKAGTSEIRARPSRQGGGRVTTKRTDRKIIFTVLNNRKLPLREHLRMLREDGVKISRSTLRRRLAENNIRSYRPTKKSLLVPRMKTARLRFAKEHKDKSATFWNNVS